MTQVTGAEGDRMGENGRMPSCPSCGADLNRGQCDCVHVERDQRWAALDALRTDLDR